MAFTIGLTYDLRDEYLRMGYSLEQTAEFDKEDTVEAIETALERLGHRTERIGHARKLMAALVAGKRWDLVFNIAEGLHGIGREAQVPAILDLYEIPYTFSDPLVMSLTLHKAMTKRVVRDAGVATADFVVVESVDSTPAIAFEPPYFAKPVAEGTGKGVTLSSIVRSRGEVLPVCRSLLNTFKQPVLVEPYLPGREVTVGIAGTGANATVLGTIEVLLGPNAEPGVYSYDNKERYEDRVTYRIVESGEDSMVAEAEGIALEAWRVLGCRDAGRIDIRCDVSGKPQFMEVNPLPGIHPIRSDLPIICNLSGISYLTLIERIIGSAAGRIGGKS